MIILLILNFRSDISKNKTFSTTKKSTNLPTPVLYTTYKTGFYMFLSHFFQPFPFQVSVLTSK